MVESIYKRDVKRARQQYDCDACDFLRQPGFFPGQFTFAEMRQIVKARQEKWKILKGTPYTYQFNKQDGLTFYFRARPEIHAICCKYDLYAV